MKKKLVCSAARLVRARFSFQTASMDSHLNLPKYEFYAILESFDYTAVVMKNQRLGRTLPKSSSSMTREEMRAIRIGGERNRQYRLADDAKRLHFILLHIGK